jgi:hypothetical protein
MTIDEALKLIQADIDDKNVEWTSPLGEAYKMSFEALKVLKNNREGKIHSDFDLLAGETNK